jgi:copper chaperone NosL
LENYRAKIKASKNNQNMKNLTLYCLYACLLVFFACKPQTKQQNTATEGIQTAKTANGNTSCGNCGMKSLDYPQWHVKKVATQTAALSYYCSPRCMFLQVNQANSPVNSTDSLFVVEYYDQHFIDARKAYYVIDSDISGPMGSDLVPLADQKAASYFLEEHKGKKIVQFTEVTNEILSNFIQ